METGLIGLPSAGKTTIFSALAGGAAGGTAGGRRSHIAEVAVPDERIGKLWELFPTAKRTYATVVIKDMAVQAGSRRPDPRRWPKCAPGRLVLVIRLLTRRCRTPGAWTRRDLRRLLDSLSFADAVARPAWSVSSGGQKAAGNTSCWSSSPPAWPRGPDLGGGIESDELPDLRFSFLTTPLL
jgi:hypothetical protein